jgi:hypothetical protein
VDPGTYVVELVESEGGRVLAASELVSVNASEVASSVVRLPLSKQTLARLFDRLSSPAAIVSTAAAAGVLVRGGTSDVSPETPQLR